MDIYIYGYRLMDIGERRGKRGYVVDSVGWGWGRPQKK